MRQFFNVEIQIFTKKLLATFTVTAFSQNAGCNLLQRAFVTIVSAFLAFSSTADWRTTSLIIGIIGFSQLGQEIPVQHQSVYFIIHGSFVVPFDNIFLVVVVSFGRDGEDQYAAHQRQNKKQLQNKRNETVIMHSNGRFNAFTFMMTKQKVKNSNGRNGSGKIVLQNETDEFDD